MHGLIVTFGSTKQKTIGYLRYVGSKACVLRRRAQGYELMVFVLHACTASFSNRYKANSRMHG